MSEEAPSLNTIRFAAMNLLAMREHSVKELQQKLARRFEDIRLINTAVALLTKENLQSDLRYTEAFINMRARQGKGPIRIAMELKEKGIADDMYDGLLNIGDESWDELARSERHKRFGPELPVNIKEKSRQIRFLQYRGFSHSHINFALQKNSIE